MDHPIGIEEGYEPTDGSELGCRDGNLLGVSEGCDEG